MTSTTTCVRGGLRGVIALAILTMSVMGTAADFAYIPNSNSKTLSVINTGTGVLATTLTPSTLDPTLTGFVYTAALRPGSANEAWFGQYFGTGNLGVIDTTNNTLKATIANVGGSVAITFSPDGSTAYVSDYTNQRLQVIDAATKTITRTETGVCTASNPISSVIKTDGSMLYFLCNNGIVRSYDTATFALADVAATGLNAYTLAYDSTGTGRIYVASYIQPNVSKIELSNNAVTAVTVNNIGATASRTLAARKDGSKFYVGDNAGTLHIINSANNATQTEVALGTAIGGVGVSANDAAVYVVLTDGTVKVVDAVTDQVTATIAAANGTSLYMIWGDFLGNVVAQAAPGVVVTPQSIPTLSEWGLILTSSLIAILGFASLRRRRQA